MTEQQRKEYFTKLVMMALENYLRSDINSEIATDDVSNLARDILNIAEFGGLFTQTPPAPQKTSAED